MQNSLSKNLFDYYPRRCPGPGGHSVARGLVPRLKPRINLGATVMPLTMLGRSILGDWAPRGMSLRAKRSNLEAISSLWGAQKGTPQIQDEVDLGYAQ